MIPENFHVSKTDYLFDIATSVLAFAANKDFVSAARR